MLLASAVDLKKQQVALDLKEYIPCVPLDFNLIQLCISEGNNGQVTMFHNTKQSDPRF